MRAAGACLPLIVLAGLAQPALAAPVEQPLTLAPDGPVVVDTSIAVPIVAEPPVPATQPANPAVLLASGSQPENGIGSIAPMLSPNSVQSAALAATNGGAIHFEFETNDQFARIAPGCGLIAASSQAARAVATCPFADLSSGLNISTSLGGFETHARFARGFINPWTSQSLLTGTAQATGYQSTVALLGFNGKLFDGRVSIWSDQAWSSSWESPFYAQPIPLQRRNERSGRASWYGIDARLVQAGRVSWTVALDYSAVGDRFFIGQSSALRTQISLPGERLMLSSKVRFGETRLTASNDRYRSEFGNSSASRFGFSRDGISLSLAVQDFDTGSMPDFGSYSSRSHALTGSFDLDVGEASSGVLARLGQSVLFPRTISLSWRNGWIENNLPATTDRYVRKSWSLSAGWETRFGETSFYYSQDRRIGMSARLGLRSDMSFQLSHMVRWNGWRAGVDGTVTRSASSKASGYRATSYAAGSTLAYQVTDGPEFMLQLSRDRDRMELNSRSYLSANDGTRVSVSLDLTAYLNQRFARKDLRLRFEFRKLLEARQEDLLDPEQRLFDQFYDRRARDVLQVSFGMTF